MISGYENININGVRVDVLGLSEAAGKLTALLSAKKETEADKRFEMADESSPYRLTDGETAEEIMPHRVMSNGVTDSTRLPLAVFTPNAEIIWRCARDARLAGIVNSGDMNLPDGVGTVWGARVLGFRLPERVPGIELGEAMLASCAGLGVGVFLLGGREGVAESASEMLKSRFPGLIVCGTHHGYFDIRGEENARVIEEIKRAAPGLLIVCLGFPRQEEWIIENRTALPGVSVMLGLGGSLDVWSGNVRRAPIIFRRMGLEWLWRILSDPSRLKRAGALPGFVLLTLKKRRDIPARSRSQK